MDHLLEIKNNNPGLFFSLFKESSFDWTKSTILVTVESLYWELLKVPKNDNIVFLSCGSGPRYMYYTVGI